MIDYQEIPPSPSLARYIDCFWSLEGTTTSSSVSPERILPDGCIEIVFNLADPFRRHRLHHPAEVQSQTIVIGQMKSFTTIEPTGRVKVFGIKFRPAGACALFDLPLSELTDRILSVDDLRHPQLKELEEKIGEAATLAERISLVEDDLTKQLIRPGKLDVIVEEGVRRIQKRSGLLLTSNLLKGISLSERQLERRFKEKVGLSPKQLSRIIRFQRIFTTYEHSRYEGWSALANACGYYDQAHLIRDFKEFSGQSPASYFQKEPDFTRHFTHRARLSDFSNTDG